MPRYFLRLREGQIDGLWRTRCLSKSIRLNHLGSTLLDRRSRSDLIETFEIVSDMYDKPADVFFDFDEGVRRVYIQSNFLKNE